MKPAELKKFRDDRNLSQEALGDLLGVRKQTVLRWENGHVEIPKTVELALEALKKGAVK